MAIVGFYYLHTNGDLIYKRGTDCAADIRESSFARAMWPLDPEDRETAWAILIEANALGANPQRVAELAAKWGCDDADAGHYADRLGISLDMDGDKWCAKSPSFVDLQESPAGFGGTCLAALSELCAALGYSGGKTWNATFRSLLAAA
jgi:hypothetical protein